MKKVFPPKKQQAPKALLEDRQSATQTACELEAQISEESGSLVCCGDCQRVGGYKSITLKKKPNKQKTPVHVLGLSLNYVAVSVQSNLCHQPRTPLRVFHPPFTCRSVVPGSGPTIRGWQPPTGIPAAATKDGPSGF